MNGNQSTRPPKPFRPLNADEQLRLWPLAGHAAHLIDRLRFVDYRQAEADAAYLAEKLLKHYAPDQLQRAAFIGIPRGGLIVLGLLAYQLDIRHVQLGSTFDSDLLILVDDCALSGLRLQRSLAHLNKHKRIAVALLYATAELRQAIKAYFPQVEQCLAAHDLPQREAGTGDGLQEYIEETVAPGIKGTLLPGPQELLSFAWNEPNFFLRTPFDDTPSHTWRFLPPHKCLKNRAALGLPPGPAYAREVFVPDGVVYSWDGRVLYLLDTRLPEAYRLDGIHAAAWRALAGYGRLASAREFIRQSHSDYTNTDIELQLKNTLSAATSLGLLSQSTGADLIEHRSP